MPIFPSLPIAAIAGLPVSAGFLLLFVAAAGTALVWRLRSVIARDDRAITTSERPVFRFVAPARLTEALACGAGAHPTRDFFRLLGRVRGRQRARAVVCVHAHAVLELDAWAAERLVRASTRIADHGGELRIVQPSAAMRDQMGEHGLLGLLTVQDLVPPPFGDAEVAALTQAIGPWTLLTEAPPVAAFAPRASGAVIDYVLDIRDEDRRTASRRAVGSPPRRRGTDALPPSERAD